MDSVALGRYIKPKTIEQVARGLVGRKFTLTIENRVRYASQVHGQAEGRRFVLSNEHLMQTAPAQVSMLLNRLVVTPVLIETALHAAANREVAWLRSFTFSIGGRQLHPGWWGDISKQLARGYRADVNGEPANLGTY